MYRKDNMIAPFKYKKNHNKMHKCHCVNIKGRLAKLYLPGLAMWLAIMDEICMIMLRKDKGDDVVGSEQQVSCTTQRKHVKPLHLSLHHH